MIEKTCWIRKWQTGFLRFGSCLEKSRGIHGQSEASGRYNDAIEHVRKEVDRSLTRDVVDMGPDAQWAQWIILGESLHHNVCEGDLVLVKIPGRKSLFS